ncbi:MAG TPA: hypothetical protein VIK07_07160 [Bacteroidales bacterium]|jgi:hypothetical protein
MNKREIIILVAVMVFLAVRLYQKYKKKETKSSALDNKTSSGTGFPSSSKDDDYEPYSKK